jgi:hypothetical protein
MPVAAITTSDRVRMGGMWVGDQVRMEVEEATVRSREEGGLRSAGQKASREGALWLERAGLRQPPGRPTRRRTGRISTRPAVVDVHVDASEAQRIHPADHAKRPPHFFSRSSLASLARRSHFPVSRVAGIVCGWRHRRLSRVETLGPFAVASVS